MPVSIMSVPGVLPDEKKAVTEAIKRGFKGVAEYWTVWGVGSTGEKDKWEFELSIDLGEKYTLSLLDEERSPGSVEELLRRFLKDLRDNNI